MRATTTTATTISPRHNVAQGMFNQKHVAVESANVIYDCVAASTVRLTPRELEVLSLLCEGLPNKLISRRLNIAAGTVKIHIGNILREMGVSSRLQAVISARHLRLMDSSALAGETNGALRA